MLPLRGKQFPSTDTDTGVRHDVFSLTSLGINFDASLSLERKVVREQMDIACGILPNFKQTPRNWTYEPLSGVACFFVLRFFPDAEPTAVVFFCLFGRCPFPPNSVCQETT